MNIPRRAGYAPRIRQAFEINVMAIAATIQTEHHHQRLLQRGGKAKRAGRKARLPAQERTGYSALALKRAVAEHGDDFIALQRFVHFKHGVYFAQRNNLKAQIRFNGTQYRVNFLALSSYITRLIRDAVLCLPSARMISKLPIMRAQQKASFAARDHALPTSDDSVRVGKFCTLSNIDMDSRTRPSTACMSTGFTDCALYQNQCNHLFLNEYF